MITCVIIDDERNAREFLEKLINRKFSKKLMVLDAADSVKNGVEIIKKRRPDLVFLDIQMPEEYGLALFNYFDTVFFDVILTTAHKEYAIEAIKKDAFDYLLKPINFIDLNDVIRKYEKKQEKNERESRVRSVLENFNVDSKEFNKLAIPTLDGYELVKISNILYCQAQDNYCNMFTYTGKEILISKTLKFVSEELLTQEVFVRIHKSYLVNLNYITSYSRQDHNITLINGDIIPVSYRKSETLLTSILKKK